jgi:hypothetical protein
VNPYEQGQIDAQRTSPQPPNCSDLDDIAAYVDGWHVVDPDRPAPTFPQTPPPRQTSDLRVRARKTLDERVTGLLGARSRVGVADQW